MRNAPVIALLGVVALLLCSGCDTYLGYHYDSVQPDIKQVEKSSSGPLPCRVRTPPPVGGGRGEAYHLAEGSGVHAHLMGIADVGCTQVGIGHQTVDKR